MSDVAGTDLAALLRAVERLDSLADSAELMGDADTAHRLRSTAVQRRLAAMEHFDD